MKLQKTGLTLVVVLASAGMPQADILEQVLVRVNGDIITKTELEQRQIAAIRQRQGDQRPGNDAELKKALAEITPAVIVDAIDELLFVQRGRELGYSLGNDQFQSILENIKKENKLETDEQFQAALQQEGMTMDDLRRQLEKQMLVTRVQQVEVMGKVSVSEDRIKELYEASREEFTTPPQVTLRELLVAVPASEKGVNVAADDAAKQKAEELQRRLTAGEDFAKLAGEASDAGSKANGGLVGPISRSDLSEELQKEIQRLKPGQLTPVLRTARGYQLLKLESVTEAAVKPLEAARDQIVEKLAARERQGEFERYLTKLREQAIFDWKNDEIKKAYELGLQQRQARAS